MSSSTETVLTPAIVGLQEDEGSIVKTDQELEIEDDIRYFQNVFPTYLFDHISGTILTPHLTSEFLRTQKYLWEILQYEFPDNSTAQIWENIADEVKDYEKSWADFMEKLAQEEVKEERVDRFPKGILTPEIIDFSTRQGIEDYLKVGITLVQGCFSPIRNIDLQLEEDPETGEEWVIINVTVQGEVGEVLDDYERYTEEWVTSVPWPEREKVCLSYNII